MGPEERKKILAGLKARYGDAAVPANPDAMPESYWRTAAGKLTDPSPSVPGASGDPGFQLPSWLRGAANVAGKGLEAATKIDDLADKYSQSATPVLGDVARGYKHGWSPLWDKALRPTLDRAEDVGELAGSPLIQAVKDSKGTTLTPQAVAGLWEDYREGGKAFAGNLRGEDGGVDFRGAVDRGTDAMELDPYVAGLAGIVGDPTNLIPGAAFTKAGKAAAKGAEAGAQVAGRAGAAAVEGLAMLPMGMGGVGGAKPPRKPPVVQAKPATGEQAARIPEDFEPSEGHMGDIGA